MAGEGVADIFDNISEGITVKKKCGSALVKVQRLAVEEGGMWIK